MDQKPLMFPSVMCEQFPSPLENTNGPKTVGVSISDVHSE